MRIRRASPPLLPPPLPLCEKWAWLRGTERGKGPERRIRVIERRGKQHLTGRRKRETEMKRETVGGGG